MAIDGPAYVEAKLWYNAYDAIDIQKFPVILQVINIIGIERDWKIINIILFAQNVFFSNLSAIIPLINDAKSPHNALINALMYAYYYLNYGKFFPKKTGK